MLSYGSSDLGGSAIELAGVELLVSAKRNVLVARTGIGIPAPGRDRHVRRPASGSRTTSCSASTAASTSAARRSTSTPAASPATRCSARALTGIRATGALAPGGSLDVTGNKLVARGDGIVAGADVLVDANTINGFGRPRPAPAGSSSTRARSPSRPGTCASPATGSTTAADAGIALRTAVRTFMVKQNVLATVGQGIVIEGKGAAERVAIDNNEVLDVATAVEGTGLVAGILVSQAASASVLSNTVVRVGPNIDTGDLGGIIVTASEDVRVAGNVVDGVGAQAGGFAAAGIAVIGPFERASVSDNSVRFSSERLGADRRALVGAADPVRRRRQGTRRQLRDRRPARERRRPRRPRLGERSRGARRARRRRLEHALGRRARAGRASSASRGDVVAEANQCFHDQAENPSAVVLLGSSVIASSNRLRGGKAALILQTAENRFAAVGNLAPGGTHLGSPGAGLPAPWQALNPNVSDRRS